MLAIMNVFENRLNFFSLALKSNVTRINVIPANSKSNNGQDFVINPGANAVSTIPVAAITKVKMMRLRINLFNNSFMC
jgi:hypothetical protein